jgi:hypothetical protein
MLDINSVIKELNETMRLALQLGEIELARQLEKKIYQLIEYSTRIPK